MGRLLLLILVGLLLVSCEDDDSDTDKPELNITGLGGTPPGITLTEGTLYPFSFLVNNTGTVDCPTGHTVRFSTSNGDTFNAPVLIKIPAGDSLFSSGEVFFMPEAKDVGTVTISITADYFDIIDERIEYNNTLSQTYVVAPLLLAPN